MRALLWSGLALLFFGLFLRVTWEMREDSSIDSWDRRLLVFISNSRTTSLNGPAVDFTALGSPTVLTLFTVIGVVVLLLNRDRRGSTYLALGSGVAGLSTYLLKHLFTRERPNIVPRLVEVSGFSYPSGHSIGASSFYLLLAFLSCRYFRTGRSRAVVFACAGILIVGVCFSRLYLGVHYPSDVLSGMLLGSAWVCLLTYVFFGRTGRPAL